MTDSDDREPSAHRTKPGHRAFHSEGGDMVAIAPVPSESSRKHTDPTDPEVPNAKRRRAQRRQRSVAMAAMAIVAFVILSVLLLYKTGRQVTNPRAAASEPEATTAPRGQPGGLAPIPVASAPTAPPASGSSRSVGAASMPVAVPSARPPSTVTPRPKGSASDIFRRPPF
ncbi:MAG TPA: hypothetical protein VJT73_17240 [Polyangiaceae bacterium]|nr:hypothetical protein [Polyangiaceae bacterium]